jgi:hypothetical protein
MFFFYRVLKLTLSPFVTNAVTTTTKELSHTYKGIGDRLVTGPQGNGLFPQNRPGVNCSEVGWPAQVQTLVSMKAF